MTTIQTDLSLAQLSPLVKRIERAANIGGKSGDKSPQHRKEEIEQLKHALGGHMKGNQPGEQELGPIYEYGGTIRIEAKGPYHIDYKV